MSGPLRQLDRRLGRRLRLRDIQILDTVVQSGSMAQAAKQLGVSQPAISGSIAQLEDALGVRLLDRTPRGVEPTIFAQALLKRGHVVFDELQQGVRDIEFLADPTVGEVRIGCPESLSASFLPSVLDRFSRSHPHICVEVAQSQPAEQEFRELRQRSVDLMLGRLLRSVSADDIDVSVLRDDRFVVAVGMHSPWAARRRARLEDLMDEHWILFPTSNVTSSFEARAFQSRGLAVPRKAIATYSMHLRLHLLATGRYVTIMHESVARYNAAQRSIKVLNIDLNLPTPIAIFTLKHRTQSPVVHRFVECMRAVAKAQK